MSNVVRVTMDGVDVTSCCVAGSWTPRLNRPAQATVTMPMDCGGAGTVWPDCGTRMMIELDTGGGFNIVFHGFVLNVETDTAEDGGRTIYNAQDPMELWQYRPVRDDDGDFSKPALITTYITGPQILEAMLMNTEGDSTAQGNGALACPTDAEGPTFLDFGSFAVSGCDLSGAPTDWPQNIAELTSTLISTGCLDVIITPTDPGGGIMGTVDAYNGDYGTDLSGSVIFQYGTGLRNVRNLRWNRDMTQVCNKYWLYGGPRIESAADPAGDQHWCFNVTGDDSGLPGFPGSDPYAAVITRRLASQAALGVRMKIDIFDGYDADCIPGFGTPGRELYRRQWITYSYLAAIPRELIHVTPTRDTALGTFGIGDLVAVEATAEVRGGFSGVQRIYQYTVSWDEDSVLGLEELQVSSDAEF